MDFFNFHICHPRLPSFYCISLKWYWALMPFLCFLIYFFLLVLLILITFFHLALLVITIFTCSPAFWWVSTPSLWTSFWLGKWKITNSWSKDSWNSTNPYQVYIKNVSKLENLHQCFSIFGLCFAKSVLLMPVDWR